MRLYLREDLKKGTEAPTAVKGPRAPKQPASAPASPSQGTSQASNPTQAPTGRPRGNEPPADYFSKQRYPERPTNAIGETDASWKVPKGTTPQYNDANATKPQEDKQQAQGQVDTDQAATPEQQVEAARANTDPYSPGGTPEPPMDPLQQQSAETTASEAAPGEAGTVAPGSPADRKRKFKERQQQAQQAQNAAPAAKEETPEEAEKRKTEARQADDKKLEDWANDPNATDISSAVLHSHMLSNSEGSKDSAKRIMDAVEAKIPFMTEADLRREAGKLAQHGNPLSEKIRQKLSETLQDRMFGKDTDEVKETAVNKPDYGGNLRDLNYDEGGDKHTAMKEKFLPGFKKEQAKTGAERITAQGSESAKKRFKEDEEAHTAATAENQKKLDQYEKDLAEYNKNKEDATNKIKETSQKMSELSNKHKDAINAAKEKATKDIEGKINDLKRKADDNLSQKGKEVDKLKDELQKLTEKHKELKKKGNKPEEAAKLASEIAGKQKDIDARQKDAADLKEKSKKELDKLKSELKDAKSGKYEDDPAVKQAKSALDDNIRENKAAKASQGKGKGTPEKPQINDPGEAPKKPSTPHEKQLNAAHKADAASVANNIKSHIENNEELRNDPAKRKEAEELLHDMSVHANLEHVPNKQHAAELKVLQKRAKQLGLNEAHTGSVESTAPEGASAPGENAPGTSSTGTKSGEPTEPPKKPSSPAEHAKTDNHRRRAHRMRENIKTQLAHDKDLDPNTRQYLEQMIADDGDLGKHANLDTVPSKEDSKKLAALASDLKEFSSKPHENSKPKKETKAKEKAGGDKAHDVKSGIKAGAALGTRLGAAATSATGGASMVGGALKTTGTGVTASASSMGHELLHQANNAKARNDKKKEEQANGQNVDDRYKPSKYSYGSGDSGKNEEDPGIDTAKESQKDKGSNEQRSSKPSAGSSQESKKDPEDDGVPNLKDLPWNQNKQYNAKRNDPNRGHFDENGNRRNQKYGPDKRYYQGKKADKHEAIARLKKVKEHIESRKKAAKVDNTKTIAPGKHKNRPPEDAEDTKKALLSKFITSSAILDLRRVTNNLASLGNS